MNRLIYACLATILIMLLAAAFVSRRPADDPLTDYGRDRAIESMRARGYEYREIKIPGGHSRSEWIQTTATANL